MPVAITDSECHGDSDDNHIQVHHQNQLPSPGPAAEVPARLRARKIVDQNQRADSEQAQADPCPRAAPPSPALGSMASQLGVTGTVPPEP